MNAKKAKAVRKLLKNVAETKPEMVEVRYSENLKHRKTVTYSDLAPSEVTEGVDPSGQVVQRSVVIASGTVSLAKDCAKGMYRNIKRSFEHK